MNAHFHIVSPSDIGWIKNDIQQLFHKGNIITYSILSTDLETVVDAEEEDMFDAIPKTEQLSIAHPVIESTDTQLILPILAPENQVIINLGDKIYLNEVSCMIEKPGIPLGSPPIVYIFEHTPTASELLGQAYLNNA